MKYVIDTNVLLDKPEIINEFPVVIISTVLREIENLERRKNDKTLQYQIREAKRVIDRAVEGGSVDIVIADLSNGENGYDDNYADNTILTYAVDNGYGLLTNDLLLKYKALSEGVDVKGSVEEKDGYTGFKEVAMNKAELSIVYLDLYKNKYDLLVNQYLVVIGEESGEVEDVLRWTGDCMMPIPRRNGKDFSRNINGIVGLKTKDVYQTMAVDSIRDNQLTLVTGKPGSGKTLLALNTAWEFVERQGYKLIIFFNPVPVSNAIPMGFYKGSVDEKSLSTAIGGMLISKFGSREAVEAEMMRGRIVLKPFVDLRGFDTTTEGDSEDTISLISEAQNLTSDLLKLGLQRIGDNTKVIIDGDTSQIDDNVYRNNNGITRMSEVFRGEDLYGEVELQEIYRSRIADIAEDM